MKLALIGNCQVTPMKALIEASQALGLSYATTAFISQGGQPVNPREFIERCYAIYAAYPRESIVQSAGLNIDPRP